MLKTLKQITLVWSLAVLIAAPAAVRAADWGCEVLLCLANPAGPMAASYCVPPIQKLFASLLKRFPDPFPQCAMVQGELGGGAYARPEQTYYDTCPGGTTAATPGQRVVMASSLAAIRDAGWWSLPTIGVGIGESAPESWDREGNLILPTKVCVGAPLGTTSLMAWVNDADGGTYLEPTAVTVYQQVIYLEPATASPRAINVYIDYQLFRTVRY